MKYGLLTFTAILFTCLFSCGKGQVNSFDTADFKVERYEYTLSHGDYLLNNSSVVFSKAGIDSAIFMDSSSKQFVLADLGKREVIRTIPYALEGPDFLDAPVHYMRWMQNKLFVLSVNYFTVFDLNGKVVQRVSLKDYVFMDNYLCTFFSIIDRSQILLTLIPKAAVNRTNYPDPKDHSIFAVLDLTKNEINPLPIESPNEALVGDPTQGYYQDFSFHQGLFKDSTIAYQFAFSSKIYLYDLRTQKLRTVPAMSKLTKNKRSPLLANHTNEEFVNYIYLDEPKFTRFMNDEVTGWYARIHEQNLPNQGALQRYLMVFDADMNTIYETQLPNYTRSSARANFFTNGKIYVIHAKPTTEDAYHFTVYDFNQ